MRLSLNGTISDKAKASFTGEVSMTNFQKWEDHWIKTAKAWRDELAAEGLTDTVKKLDEIIAWQDEHRMSRG
jgi:hypothetical protein